MPRKFIPQAEWDAMNRADRIRVFAESLIVIAHNMDRGALYDVVDLEQIANNIKATLTE